MIRGVVRPNDLAEILLGQWPHLYMVVGAEMLLGQWLHLSMVVGTEILLGQWLSSVYSSGNWDAVGSVAPSVDGSRS